MNILASYKWIKEYLKTDLSAEDFARELSLRSMSVEKIEKLSEKFDKMVVGVIKEIKAHPNANKLRIAVTDIGSAVVEIVCGGSNIAVGQKVFVALPGSKVRWHGEGDLIELKETEIRGVRSIGMICAPAEVGFEKLQGGEHEIWDLTNVTTAQAGTPIAEALDLQDTVFDIEITTNRPDCMSIVGLAREGSTAVDGMFSAPKPSNLTTSQPSNLSVSIDSKLCPRYMAAVVKNVKVGPSPWWLQQKLLLAGHRPINNIVDITNFVLHEYGQPLHAFDAAKLHGQQIVVREAKKGEKLKALDGKEYELSKKHLVIADAHGPLAVAGVMGGEESGTTSDTTTVVFEAATFDPVSVRKTSRDLNLYSDSQLVFEKGLSTEALPQALVRALELAVEIAGGTVEGVTDVRRAPYKPVSYSTTTKKIRERIGVDISDEEITSILSKLGFALTVNGTKISAIVPFWRDHDIEGEIDLTEEVARMYGYHKMPSKLPALTPPPAQDDVSVMWEDWVKQFAANAGFTEFFSLSFVDARDLEKYGISPENAVKILNPLSEELGYMRPSLIPSMLRSIERNQANVPHAHVFEVSRIYLPQTLSDGEGSRASMELPREELRLAVAKYGFNDVEAAFMTLKGTLQDLARETGLSLHFNRLSTDEKWHATRSAEIYLDHPLLAEEGSGEVKDRVRVGVLGQVAHVYTQAFGIEEPVFMIDLNLELLIPHMKFTMRYEPIGEFPSSERDISFAVNERTQYEDVVAEIMGQDLPTVDSPDVKGLVKKVELVDIYRGAGVEEGKKSLTVGITFAANDRTLTSDEVEYAVKKITDALQAKFGAVLRG